MSGASFMRPYGAHDGHWIKQNDETRNASPLAITDDSELIRPLKPSTTYLFKCELYFTAGTTSYAWRPACTSALDFASIIHHRPVGSSATETWATASGGDHQSHMYNTAHFNTGSTFNQTQAGNRRCYGMIRTGSSGGTFSIMWGGGNGSRTLKAGSFIYLKEIPDSSIIIKQADESRASNSTLTDDGELTIALDASTTYFIDSNVIFDSGATPGFKQSWTYTGTLTSVGLSEGASSAVLPSTGGAGDAFSRPWHVGAGAILTTPTVRTRVGSNTASTIGGGHLRGVIVTNGAGNLKIQWAQTTSTGTNTTVHKGSYICVAKGTAIADVFGTLVYKTGDTSRTNNTVSADPDLVFTTKANGKYIAESFTVFDSSSATPDIRFGIHDAQANLSAGHTLRINVQAVGTFGGASDTGLWGQWNTAAWITTPTLAVTGTNGTANKTSFFTMWAQQQGGSDGTSAVEWAQDITNATATILRTGSWILSETVVQ